MVNLTGFTRFENQTDLRAPTDPNQMMMETTHGEERRNGGMHFIHSPITENEDVRPFRDRALRLRTDICHRQLQPRCTLIRSKKGGDRDRLEPHLIDVLEFGQILVGQDRRL